MPEAAAPPRKRRGKAAPAARTRDEVLAEVAEVAEALTTAEATVADLYARRAALFHEGRACDPKVTQAALAVAAGVSETAVITALRKPAPATNGARS